MSNRSLIAVGAAGLALASGVAAYLLGPHLEGMTPPPDKAPAMESAVPLRGAVPRGGDSSPPRAAPPERELDREAKDADTGSSKRTASSESLDWSIGALGQETTDERREALPSTHRKQLEAALSREAIDAPWARTAQAELEAAYGMAQAEGVNFDEAECRSTMCRVTLTLDHPGKAGEIQMQRLMDRPAPWPAFRYLQLDRASGTAVVFVMREGHQLPALAAEAGDPGS